MLMRNGTAMPSMVFAGFVEKKGGHVIQQMQWIWYAILYRLQSQMKKERPPCWGGRLVYTDIGVNQCQSTTCQSAFKRGSDSLSLIFGGDVVLFSKGNQQHGEEFGRFVPDAGRSGR